MVVAAFFLIWGYFSTHQVVFRPWGLQNTKNAFYKKMLCDQASDGIISRSLPAMSHPSLATPILLQDIKGFVNAQGGDQPSRPLSMARVYTTPPYPRGPACDRCAKCRVLSRVLRTRSTPWLVASLLANHLACEAGYSGGLLVVVEPGEEPCG